MSYVKAPLAACPTCQRIVRLGHDVRGRVVLYERIGPYRHDKTCAPPRRRARTPADDAYRQASYLDDADDCE